MKMKWTLLVLAILCLALLAGSEATQAQGEEYELWWTVDGGGTTSGHDGSYTLGATIGQHDAGQLSDGSYTLGGGFWGGGEEPAMRRMYLPIIMK